MSSIRHRPGKSRPIVVTVSRDFHDKAVFRYGSRTGIKPRGMKVHAGWYWLFLAALFLAVGWGVR